MAYNTTLIPLQGNLFIDIILKLHKFKNPQLMVTELFLGVLKQT